MKSIFPGNHAVFGRIQESIYVSERWLSVDEIASYLRANPAAVCKWITRKSIPAHKFGRPWKFLASEVACVMHSLVLMNFSPCGIEDPDTSNRKLRDDTAIRVNPNPQPQSRMAGLLRSERQLLANPPIHDSDWFRKHDDESWQFGVPLKGDANFAWVQHFIRPLAPQGMGSFVLAYGTMSSNPSGRGDIRRALVEANLVDRMFALPGQLFYSTQIQRQLLAKLNRKSLRLSRN